MNRRQLITAALVLIPIRHVSAEADFQQTLDAAEPGQTITVPDGITAGRFVLTSSGTEEKPILITGTRAAVLQGEGWEHSGYGLHLQNVSWVELEGFTITDSQKGVVCDGCSHITLRKLEVHTTGHEAIHLRSHTTDSLVDDCDIHDTGLDRDKFGEGVYIGSAVSNWERYTDGKPDESHRNTVRGNRFWATASECIDIKEGTRDGLVENNSFDGADMTGADSWVDVKGTGYTIRNNNGVNAPEDGFQTHVIDGLGGDANVFEGNTAEVNGPGFGFYIHDPETTGNSIDCSNVVTSAESGFSNLETGCELS